MARLQPSLACSLVILLVLFLSCFVSSQAQGWNLTLLHTSDTFSQLTAVDVINNPCIPFSNGSYVSAAGPFPCLGGAPRMKTVIDQVRSRSTNVVLADVGNILQSSLFYYLFGPELIASYFNALEYDFIHWQVLDFIGTAPVVVKFMRSSNPDIKFVVSNLEGFNSYSQRNGTTILGFATKTFADGEKVGFAATMAQGVETLAVDLENITSTEEASAMLVAVASLANQGVTKIIAAVSGPATADRVLRTVPGIDVLIVAGKTPTSYPEVFQALWAQPVLVVSSGQYGQQIGVLDVSFDANGVITSYSGQSLMMDDSVEADPTLQGELVDHYSDILARYDQVIGYTAVNLSFDEQCLFAECTIGSWLGDVFKKFGDTQIAFNNGGSTRAGIDPGFVTLGEQQKAFPFGTADFYTFKLQGRYVFEALENGVSLATRRDLDVNSGAGKFLQVSGIRFSYNPQDPPGSRVVDVEVEVSPNTWEMLDFEANYTVSAFNFIAIYGGDGYTMVSTNLFDLKSRGANWNKIVLDAIAQNVTSVQTGRITITSASRSTCMAADGSLCNNNGYCITGVCKCTVPGASGQFCALSNDDSSGDSSEIGLALGLALGLGIPALLLLAFCVLAALIALRISKDGKRDDSWEIDITELQLTSLLGSGGYGEVYRSVWKGTDVAVKVMNVQSAGRGAAENFKQEVHLMTTLRHPNVVLFMAACTKPPRMCIVMELMALGSLFDLLHNELVPSLPFSLVLKLSYQAAKGMHFLHSSGIVHRDLKSLNLLLDAKWNLKVSDFGLTKFRADLKKAAGEDVQGTIHWTAPEVLGDDLDVDYMQADVYSYGIILWELITREQPYRGLSPAAIAVGVIRDGMRPDWSLAKHANEEYLRLMTDCWHQDPTMRPPFLDAMSRTSHMLEAGSFIDNSSSTSNSSISIRTGWNTTSGNLTSSSGSATSQDMVPETSAPSADHLTVVFSDVTNAAALWEANPTGMREALTLHNKLVRQLIGHHRGYESLFNKNQAQGEGYFCVVFSRVTDALRWCEEVQRELPMLEWPDNLHSIQEGREAAASSFREHIHSDMPGLQVRMGVHHGSVSRTRDIKSGRYEFFGQAVQVATQLAMYAEAGQVLVTKEVTKHLENTSGGSGSSSASNKFVSLPQLELQGANGGSLMNVDVFELTTGVTRGRRSKKSSSTRSGSESDDGEHDASARLSAESFIGSSNACRWIISYDELSITREDVGQGSYGIVSKAKWKGVEVAVKRFVKQKLDEDTMLRFREEAALLAELRHPNVVLFIGACLRAPNMCIVTEWIGRGSLRSVLSDNSIKISWQTRLRLLQGIVLGLSYLHSMKPPILHRDLKSSNVLVDDSWNAKIADFGFARIKEENVTMTKCGTPAWIAPEVIKRERYTEKADIYSIGIVMWEVATRRIPFAGDNFTRITLEVLEGKRPQVPASVPKNYSDLMSRCWHRKPHKRPSADDICHTIEEWLEDPKGDAMV